MATSRKICTLPKAAMLDSVCVAADGPHVAYFTSTKTEMFAVVDGKTSVAYHDIRDLALSSDGAHVAFSARTNDGARMIVDGKPGDTFYTVGQAVFNAKGEVAYEAIYPERGDEHKRVLVLGSKKRKSFEAWGPPIFSADGKSMVRTGVDTKKNKDGESKHQFFVSHNDAKPKTLHDNIGGFAVSGNGKMYAYGANDGGRCVLVVDGKAQEIAGVDYITRVALSNDGTALAYVTRKANVFRVIFGDDKSAAFASVIGLVVHGNNIAYSANTGGKRDRAGRLSGGKWRLMLNGKASEPFDDILRVGFSDDGKQVGYAARNDRTIVWCVTPVT